MNLTLGCKVIRFCIFLPPTAARMLWSKKKAQGPGITDMEEILTQYLKTLEIPTRALWETF